MSFDPTTLAPKVPTFNYTPTGRTQAKAQTTGTADGTDQPTGAGSAGAPGAAPDVNSTNVVLAGAFMLVALGTLEDLMPKGLDSGDALDVELAAALAKLKKTTDDVDKGKITTDAEAQKAALDAQKKALEDAQKKSEQAAESAKHVSLADKFKLAFTWIGAIVAVVVAAVMIATGVGAAVGVALIAAAVIAIAMAVDQTMEMANQASGKNGGLSMFGMMFQAIGEARGLTGDDLAAFTSKATMGLNIALMIVSIALSFVNPEGAENALTGVAKMGPNMAKLGEDASRMEKIVATVQDIGLKVVSDIKGTIKELTESLKDAKSALGTMKEEGLVAQLEKAADKIETLFQDLKGLKGVAQKGINEIKDELKDLLAELKDVKDLLVKLKQEGPAKQVEKAYAEIKALLNEIKDTVVATGKDAISGVKDTISGAKQELQTLKEDGPATYALDKLKNALMDLAESLIDKVAKTDDAGTKTFSGARTAKSVRNAGQDVQNKGNVAASTYADVQQYKADTATGESKQFQADALKQGGYAKNLSAAIDMVLAMMKKHGEAFDTQIDQVMDAMRSHQRSVTHTAV